MNINTLLLSALLALSPFTAIASPDLQTQAQTAIHDAHTLWDNTKVAGHEWNTIKPFMAQANQALAAKDYTTAIDLAHKAAKQSTLALEQAEREKTNWINNLPK